MLTIYQSKIYLFIIFHSITQARSTLENELAKIEDMIEDQEEPHLTSTVTDTDSQVRDEL